ncbi:GDSL-type esterase/lipase family protein [Conexibacter woesei]|uniref:SGNH hydrolase-type esterase domain-containing protein n=1 Tax=Conexibacter woesei (strain DSM 14684 / CCUG 47730 / CIP 108061 / JCM 11494 / NBRC 100937 / ID131577) TaxID=469383 RepID=D3F0K0_CONWI|nr:GDSL-type esterase/lipase family protein [Conexibacter woesei]ADB53934.1 hypothetical protein Cwoe_5529 [Conexibacter woesei DSM 14684]
MIPPRFISGAVAVVAAAALAVPAAATAARAPPAQGKKAAPQFYVSLGDSYATGYQPKPDGTVGGGTREGFAYQLPPLAARKGWKLRLVQFGCGGATTTSILEQKGCPKPALGPGGRPYPGKTQIQVAEQFLKQNRAKTGLITVSIGGNDVTACIREADPVSCVVAANGKLQRNVAVLVRRLRRAAGPRVRIVGTTYPDVILGLWLTGDAGRNLATLSVTAFREIINPALKKQYDSVRGAFVDVTRASGAYTPFDQTTTVPGLGTIPVAVANVCVLTWFCAVQDIHARGVGYQLIAELIAGTLPKQRASR